MLLFRNFIFFLSKFFKYIIILSYYKKVFLVTGMKNNKEMLLKKLLYIDIERVKKISIFACNWKMYQTLIENYAAY